MSDADASILPVLPAAVTAMQDGALQGNPREVYMWFFHHLDVQQYRAVKLVEIEYALGMSEASASIAVRKLVDLGYIERVRASSGSSYRLVHSNPAREPRQGADGQDFRKLKRSACA
ncbi:MAG TPA: hypothetical protein VN613_09480 [Gemmatimonadaceae bacterium]|nr:hypothetical protein [Gemmatimonadaceae bacterium]